MPPKASRRKSAANGTPKTSQSPARDLKSPAQPADLSAEDREKLRQYLDKDKPFNVHIEPLNKKRKRSPLIPQTDLWQDRLSVQYEVKPRSNWESLRRYKKFTVGSESIATGEYILVKHDDTEDAKIDIVAQWKAKVLEVRALDQEHVYVRVAWFNRPEDLPTGRQPYHGKNELIPSNEMDIIDAMAVNGRLEVIHWDEFDDDSAMMPEDQYFWRQTYEFLTSTYSDLRRICVDDAPQNPDEMILQCSNAECRKWMHVKCIAEEAVLDASDQGSDNKGSPTSKKRGRPKSLTIAPTSTVVAKAQKLPFLAELTVKDHPSNIPDVQPAERTELVITNGESEKQTQKVRCLFCEHAVE